MQELQVLNIIQTIYTHLITGCFISELVPFLLSYLQFLEQFFLDVDDFIVDDDGNPIKHVKKKRRIPGTVQDS